MSAQHYYHLCNRAKGRSVEIVTKDGMRHRGIINHVDREYVYLQPIERRSLGGYGYGYWGPQYPSGYGYRPGFGLGIALGVIGTLAFLPLFFW